MNDFRMKFGKDIPSYGKQRLSLFYLSEISAFSTMLDVEVLLWLNASLLT
jgi:hypothetical protein